MLRSHKHRFIYFAPRKTGSTSIHTTLNKHFDDLEQVNMNRHQMILPKSCRSYVTFMSVRNPYSRFLSLYNFFYDKPVHAGCHYDSIQKRAELLGGDEEWRYKSMYDELHTSPERGCVPMRVDYVVHLETLEKDFNQLPFITDKISMPHMTISKKRASVLSSKVARMVREFYAKDFEFFGYDPDRFPWTLSMPKVYL